MPDTSKRNIDVRVDNTWDGNKYIAVTDGGDCIVEAHESEGFFYFQPENPDADVVDAIKAAHESHAFERQLNNSTRESAERAGRIERLHRDAKSYGVSVDTMLIVETLKRLDRTLDSIQNALDR